MEKEIPSLARNVDEVVVVLVVGAADAVIPLPAVLLVPVAADQMAESLIAEGGKCEYVPRAALRKCATDFCPRSKSSIIANPLQILFIFCSVQPAGHSAAYWCGQSENAKSIVGLVAFVPPSQVIRPPRLIGHGVEQGGRAEVGEVFAAGGHA